MSKAAKRPGPELPADVAVRPCLLRMLASLLGYPTPHVFATAKENLAASLSHADSLDPSVRLALISFSTQFERMGREQYEAEFLDVFTHVSTPDCNPCETSYLASHIFQVSQRLSQITGFYSAFGLEVEGERADHVSVELEFLAYLAYREALETADGSEAKSQTMRLAQARFVESHIGKWASSLAALVRRRSPRGVMGALADLFEATVRSEAARHKVGFVEFLADAQIVAKQEGAPVG